MRSLFNTIEKKGREGRREGGREGRREGGKERGGNKEKYLPAEKSLVKEGSIAIVQQD